MTTASSILFNSNPRPATSKRKISCVRIDRHPDSKEDALQILKSWKNMAPKTIFIRNKFFALALALAGLGASGESMGGDKFSIQGNALHAALIEDLVKQGVCGDHQSCFNVLQIFGEDGDRIYLNMYAQTDRHLGAIVARFFIEHGLKASGGMPITLRIYSDPKSKYLRFKSMFNRGDEFVKLEINK